MSTYTINSQFTLAERAKGSIDGKRMEKIIDVLNIDADDFYRDVPFVPCNMGLLHKIRRSVTTPTGTWRTFNAGVASEAPTTQVVYEPVGLLEGLSEVDEDEIDTLENGKEERAARDRLYVSGMGKSIVDAFINGARSDGPERIDGLKPRLNSLALKNVVSAGYTTGGSTCTSIYLVEWDIVNGAHGLYPSAGASAQFGKTYGIDIRDKGKLKKADPDTATKSYFAYTTQFKSWLGLCVRNELKVARMANIDGSSAAATKGWDENGLIKLLNLCKFNRYKTRIYVNQSVATQIDVRSKDKANVNWSTVEVFGRPARTFQGCVVRMLDNEIIKNTEAVVS